MDGPDLEFLKSEACKLALVNIHVEAILQYISFTPTIPPVSVVRLLKLFLTFVESIG